MSRRTRRPTVRHRFPIHSIGPLERYSRTNSIRVALSPIAVNVIVPSTVPLVPSDFQESRFGGS